MASTIATAFCGLDLADLQIGARGDMRVAAAIALGEVGKPGELPVLEDAVRDAQAAHVGILVRRDIEQAEKPPAEIVRRLRRLVVARLLLEPLVAVEGMLLALELFLIGELFAGSETRSCALSRGIRSGRLGRRSRAHLPAGTPATLFAAFAICTPDDKALQIAFLFGAEIAGLDLRPRCDRPRSFGRHPRRRRQRRRRGSARLVSQIEREPVKTPPPTRLPSVTGI